MAVDFTEFRAFVEKMQDAFSDEEITDFQKQFLLEHAERVVGDAKKNTPVGTPESTGVPGYIGGSLRAAWGIGDPGYHEFLASGKGNQGGTGAVQDVGYENLGADVVDEQGNVISVSVWNGMNYANFVEMGYKPRGGNWKEGRFMLTKSMDENEKQMQSRWDAKLEQWKKEKGFT